MINKHILISYPRSGSNYFQLAWKQKTNKYIPCFRTSKHVRHVFSSHDVEKIALIRNPVDSISSSLLIGIVHEDKMLPFEHMVEYSISEYEKIYELILKDADYIIDISDFNKIDKIINYIYKKDLKNTDEDKIINDLNEIKKYSRTFIKNEQYPEIKDIVMKENLEKSVELYNLAYIKRLVV